MLWQLLFLTLYGDPMNFMKEKIPDWAYEVSIGQIRNSQGFFCWNQLFFKILLVAIWQLCPLEVIIETYRSESKCFWQPKYVIIDYLRSYATIRNEWGDMISKGTAVVSLSYYYCLKMNKNKSLHDITLNYTIGLYHFAINL